MTPDSRLLSDLQRAGTAPDLWRQSTIGELVIQAAMASGALAALRWLPQVLWGQGCSALIPVLAAAWIVCRGAGVARSRLATATTQLAGAALWLALAQPLEPRSPEAFLLRGLFSMRSLAMWWALLGLFDAIAVARWWWCFPGTRAVQELEQTLRRGLLTIFVLALSGLVLGPLVQQWWQGRQPQPTSYELTDLSTAEAGFLLLLSTLSALWFAFLGAAIGSFLNVVAWRLPRHATVVRGGSHCPSCAHPIERRDNIPLWGWFRLRGRCRHCNTAISGRYPVIELITLGLFLLVYFRELISGGANLPLRKPYFNAGVVWILFYTKWELLGLALFHVWLLGVLLVWSLIDHDRQGIPLRSIAWVLVLTALMLGVMPAWQLVPWSFPWIIPNHPVVPLQVLGTPAIGLAAGLLTGLSVTLVWPRLTGESFSPGTRFNLAAAIALVGLGWGWQAVVPVCVLLWPTWFLFRSLCGRPFSAVATLALLILWHHLTWNQWPGWWRLLVGS
ncbi:MAG: prepilin peptidase [Planctomycetaceae bacterium]